MIPLWLHSSFDLLVHGELHYTLPEEFDRRVALVSFDNAIEASIAWYLSLHPTHRGNRTYNKVDVDKALINYHSKLDFFYQEVTVRSATCSFSRQEVVYIHDQRNLFYHGNPDYVPSSTVLDKAREAAFWIFEFLFEVKNVEGLVQDRVKEIRKLNICERDQKIDELIDLNKGDIDIYGIPFKPSEILYVLEPNYYSQLVRDMRRDLEQENVAN